MLEEKTRIIKFHSDILNKEMAMSVYIPEQYKIVDSLPVLYFLHGRSGDENMMSESGLDLVADRLIQGQEINPLIIVCPRIENSRGINSSIVCREVVDPVNRIINLGMYEDYFIKEVIPLIDKMFHTIKEREGRYVGGVSAGGYAALHNAFRHQSLFSKVGGHMPAIELTLEKEDQPYFENMEIWNKYDPINIAKNEMDSVDMKVFLDAGNQDEGEFYKGCSLLHGILQEKNIISQNHVFVGHHNLEYVQSNLEKYLKFYSQLRK